ncbi:hypothetical protein ACXX82_24675, partial [Glaciimonas sp. GNP009]
NTQHPTPNTQHPTPNTQHPTPNTQHPTPNTQHPTPNTLSTFNLEISGRRARPRDAASRLPPLCCLNALFFDVDQRISATSLPLLPTQDNRQQWVQFE